MLKHAFIILAHDNPKTLQYLINQLDDPRNDIYIHLDKKSSLTPEMFSCKNTYMEFIERTKCYWGDYTQTNATLRLLEAALKHNKEYKYIHLLSGTTLCTKSQDQIHEFYDNTDLEYFHISRGIFKSIQVRCKYYYPFINTNAFRKHKLLKGISLILGKIQFLIGINRLRNNQYLPLINGFEWFSITSDFAEFILKNEPWVKRTFNHTLAAEEVFVQTLGYNSIYKERVFGLTGKDDFINESKTFQFWNNGKSTCLSTKEQWNIAKNNKNSFFVRKIIDKDLGNLF